MFKGRELVLTAMVVGSKLDGLGNFVAHFQGSDRRVMLLTHMDQLGFIMHRIEVDGLVRK